MAEERVQRRLTAILAADVVGYSRLIGMDEEGTIARLKAVREELIDPDIARHQGRIVKTTGDGILVEFPSVVDAVRCAVAVQRGLTEREAEVREERRIELRIGVNLGDIVIDGDDILGNGVNVAARLEGLAEPGGVCVSGTVHEHVAGKLDLDFEDMGSQEVKNIAEPVRVWRWAANTGARALGPAMTVAPPPLPDKPSIAVLAFENMSGDPEQEYFSDGVAEDIITGLSRNRGFFVIARNSSFTYKGQAVDVTQIARDLGVRYVLEGSVRKAGNRVRISAQLIDATTGNHIWAERYDHDLDDIFRVQDEVTQSIVAALPGQLEAADLERARHKPTKNLAAYEYVLRGRDHHHRETKDDNEEALQFIDLALDLDPEFSEAYSWRACTIGQAMNQGYLQWSNDLVEQALKDAQRALELDDNDTEAHRIMCRIRLLFKQFDQSEFHLQRALALNPNDPRLALQKGINLTWLGDPDGAVTWIREAMRLDPYHEGRYSFELGCALFVGRQYDDAMAAFKRTGIPKIQHNCYIAGCAAQMDEVETANSYATEVIRAKSDFSTDEYLKTLPYKNRSDLNHHREALNKAGLPE